MLNAASPRAEAPAAAPAAPAGPYLRRYRAARPRPRWHGPLAFAVAAVTLFLFARVWQVTAAHALAKEHDQLRRDVRGLENRIRLNSELSMRDALREGLDYKTFAKEGFESPDPSRVIDIDLERTLPLVRRPDGTVASLSSRVGRFVQGLWPGARDARAEERGVVPVSAEISR